MVRQLIVTRAPFRISLFGGGTDFFDYYSKNHSKIISFSINKYIYVILKKRDDDFYYINYSIKEITKNINAIKHDIIREILKFFKIKSGLEISIISDIPSKGSGLGSSSALCCALILAITKLQRIKISQKKIASLAVKIEIEILKKPIGVQDQYGCAMGGLKVISMKKNEIKISKISNHKLQSIIENNSILYDTKKNRKSEEILKNQKSLIKLNIDKLNKISNLSKEFIKNCKKNVEIEDFIFQLNETWNLKKNLEKNISNDLITQKMNKLKKYGYEGFKLCGAGKGGFIFAVKKTKIPKNLLTNMKRIKIDNDGVVLLFQEK